MDMSMEESDDDRLFDDGFDPQQPQQYEDEEEEEEDMSMEMTQSYGGGIVSHRPQHHEQEEADQSFMTETSTRSDEEKTMEFTIAIGGFLPPNPPTGAKKGRASVGYNHLDLSGSAALVPGEDEGDMEMDETVAFGGVINTNHGDDTISTNASDDTVQGQGRERTMTFNFGDLQSAALEEQANMGVGLNVEVDLDMDMDMTTVGGGIHTHQHSHVHAHVHAHPVPQVQQRNIFAQGNSATPKSPHRPLTLPSGSTPSFARPTTSSAQKSKKPSKSPEKEKSKRNIFGPSPSPAKSLATTPRKSGMGIAGEVAKRLSFGSVSASGGKRPIEAEEEEGGKRQRLSVVGAGLGDSIFGRPRLSTPLGPTRGTPRKSLAPQTMGGTPRKSLGAPSPKLIPTINIQPEADEEEVEMEVRAENWEPVAIGLASFLQMAGVEFVDSLPTMARRKSGGRGLGDVRGEYLSFPLLHY